MLLFQDVLADLRVIRTFGAKLLLHGWHEEMNLCLVTELEMRSSASLEQFGKFTTPPKRVTGRCGSLSSSAVAVLCCALR